MPPKKATSTTAAPKKAAPAHASYRDMIKDAIVNLKERNGSSRQAIKKYVSSNNKINVASQATFDAQFNKAIKAGVEKGEFTQPKGPSGPVKLAKKEPAPKAPKKEPAAKKAATAKKPAAAKATAATKEKKAAAPKKAAAKATTTTKTTGTAKKASTTKKTTAAKPKANSGKARKTTTAAPAIVEQPKVLGTTKSGRVTKTTAASKPATKKRTTPKK
ncbi:Histone H1 [Penicillium oxalicum]|uniref:Histone H1 n=1 Tax=Penicillium oxalicum (strain 114-2 / CGMCC 5302) TaxID=933388 RepID=S7Z8U9_PENO1|nr:Histone H1 [Penicillium oxalicum]EPS26634.1 hypothetical protein PDE_01572 [Penicillium oxalicum 114-2]KAI2786674.1 Histone H1 [Penicillium oxalicum]